MIETLTKEQEEAIIPFREKWIARILRTEQTDEQIKENVKGIYTLAGLEQPKQVWIMDSMLGVQIAINYLKNSVNNLEDIYSNIRSNLESNIRSNIESNIYSNIRSNIYSNLESNIRSNIESNIRSNIRSNLESNIYSNIRSNIYSNIRSNIRSNLESNIYSNIYSNIRSNIYSNIRSNIYSNLESNKLQYFGFSSNEASWLQWYIYQKYYYDNGLLLEDKYSKLLNSYIEMAIDAWAVYYSKDIAIVSRKPKIERNTNGRLHSEKTPAVSFKDGYELYYLHGVNFPKPLWEKVVSRKMPFSEILAIEDVDQRRQALKYGKWDDFVKHQNAVKIDTFKKLDNHGEPVEYELWEFPEQNGDNRLFSKTVHFARYGCPSVKDKHVKGVPEFKTVAEAMAWGMSDEKEGRIMTAENWKLLVPLVDEA